MEKLFADGLFEQLDSISRKRGNPDDRNKMFFIRQDQPPGKICLVKHRYRPAAGQRFKDQLILLAELAGSVKDGKNQIRQRDLFEGTADSFPFDQIVRMTNACRIQQPNGQTLEGNCFLDDVTGSAGYMGYDRPVLVEQPVKEA